jgi:hypothetical protein
MLQRGIARLERIHTEEDGHAGPFLASVVAGVGAILLAIGAAAGTGWLAIVGGIVLAVGFVGYDTVHHFMLDRDFYGRIDELSDRPHAPTPSPDVAGEGETH